VVGENVGLVGARVLGAADGLFVEGYTEGAAVVGLLVGGAVSEDAASSNANSRAIAERRSIAS